MQKSIGFGYSIFIPKKCDVACKFENSVLEREKNYVFMYKKKFESMVINGVENPVKKLTLLTFLCC